MVTPALIHGTPILGPQIEEPGWYWCIEMQRPVEINVEVSEATGQLLVSYWDRVGLKYKHSRVSLRDSICTFLGPLAPASS